MAGTSNYATTWTFNSESYKCIVTGWPEISTGTIITTNHSGAGKAENIPDGVVTVGEFTLEVLEESGNYSALNNHVVNKTTATSVIDDAITSISGSSWVKSVKKEDADAQSPDAAKLTVVVSATGTWTVA